MKKILYSAIFNDYDPIKEMPKQEDWRYILFTDKEVESDTWEVNIIKEKDEPLIHRKIKCLPHIYLPEHDFSLWIDGKVKLYNPEKFAKENMVVQRHCYWWTLQEELEMLIKLKKVEPSAIIKQIEHYFKEGYPDTLGLFDTCILGRKNTTENRKFNEAWWQEIKKFTHRDQPSFMYLLWKLNPEYVSIPFMWEAEWKANHD